MSIKNIKRGDNMPRNGTKNLIPTNKRSKEEAKRIGKKGGIASGRARREKKTLRQCLEILLEKTLKDKKGIEMTGAEAVSLKVFEKALKGDIKAFEVLRDTAGQKPVEKVQMKTDINIAESAERLSNIFDQIKEEK